MTTLRASKLTTFSVAADGATVTIGVADLNGKAAALVLPAACLQALVMTLPEMANEALRRKSGDPQLRLVFPVADWTLEKITGGDRLILTFVTSDGFRASFTLSPEELVKIAGTALTGEVTTGPSAAAWPNGERTH